MVPHVRREKNKRHIFGKVMAVIQLIFSAGFVVKLALNGMIPAKYIVVAVLTLTLLFGIALALAYGRNNMRYVGAVISIAICIAAALGLHAISKVDFLIEEVSGKEYKTDNMVAVVRIDDPAEIIDELIDADCPFAVQTMADQKNNAAFIAELEKGFKTKLVIKEYDTVIEEAEALLNGEVDAAIYNKAFTSLIEGKIEDYTDKVRVIYEQGIKTQLTMVNEEVSIEEPFNIYISGIDIEGPIAEETSCSDVNIIMTVNPAARKILLTTTPRDYYVTIPEISGVYPDKLTHAGIYSNDAYYSVRTLEELYGTQIPYYARVNFTSVVRIIDALGGVVVHSDFDFAIGDYTYHKGDNRVDGEAALFFVRARECFEDGDNQRGRNQQELIRAVFKKVMTPEILIKADAIIGSVADSVMTNIPRSLMTKFINMQLKNGADWTIETSEVTGYPDSLPCFSMGSEGEYYVTVPDDDSVNEAAYKIRMVLEGN